MKSWMEFAGIVRFVLGAALVSMGAAKSGDILHGSPLALPTGIVVGAMVVEIALGCWVVFGRGMGPLYAAQGLAWILLVSTFVMTSVGVDIRRCGCFGHWRASITEHLLVIGGMLVLSMIAAWAATTVASQSSTS